MKFYLSSKIKKIVKITSIVILAVTVIIFWVVVSCLFIDEWPSNNKDKSDCNVANIKLYGDLYTYVKETDDCKDCASSEEVVNQIRDAEANNDIKAILLTIDSTGGNPVAAEEIANTLKQASKPTVALIRSSGDSGAYFAATGAERIFASDMSDVGSIGITSSYVDNSKKNQKDGLTYNSLSLGKYKDTGNPDKPLTDEEKKMILNDLQVGYDIFIKNVANNRHLDIEKVKVLADGNSMDGQKALDNGLIDQLGSLSDVETYLANKIGGETLYVCR